MIYPIKVWRRKGLRRLLRHDMAKSMSAKEVMEEQQKHYQLSSHERAKFNRMCLDDAVETPTPRPMKSIAAIYKVICVYCGKQAMRSQARAKYCSDACYRAAYSQKQYQRKGRTA